MAKVWVYVWNHVRGGEGAAWGHSSLQVEGGPYISWWPSSKGREYMVDQNKHPRLAGFMKSIIGTTNVYSVKHKCAASYQQDIQNEGGHAAQQVAEIADGVLDTQAISLWWTGYAYESATYHVIKKNCSTTVIRALRAGGSDKLVSMKKLGFSGRGPRIEFLEKQTGWEPTDIWAYLKLMNKGAGDRVNLNGAAMNTPPPRNTPHSNGDVQMCETHGEPLLQCSQC